MKGMRADFSEVKVSLFPLRYQINRLKLRERNPKTKEPAFYAEEIAVNLRWGRLLTGHLVGSAEAKGVKVVLHQPTPGSPPGLPPIEKLVPIRAVLERAHVTQGEVLYVWVYEKDQPSIWFHGIEGSLENVGSRPGMVKGPTVISAHGQVQHRGAMSVSVNADPYATPLSFGGRARVSDFDLSQLNGLFADKKGIKLTPGSFDMEMMFQCQKGRLRGWIEPHLTGTEITAAGQNLGAALKALFSKVSMTLAQPTEGTTPSGRIEVADDLTDPKLQFLPALEKVIERGLMLGVEEALKRNAAEKRVKAPEKPTDLKTGG
jgi:hypothetical protein